MVYFFIDDLFGRGEILLPQMIINKQEASDLLKDFILNNWCGGKHTCWNEVENLQLKFQQLFQSPEKQQRLLQQILNHQPFQQQHLFNFVFGKELLSNDVTRQQEGIYAFQIGEGYLIHFEREDEHLEELKEYIYQIYSIFTEIPLIHISQPMLLMQHYKEQLLKLSSKNRVVCSIHRLIQQIEELNENEHSLKMKQLHLLNVMIHFTSGNRHLYKLKKLIRQVELRWRKGEWALTEKEKVLLSYILMKEAAVRKQDRQVIQHGLHLINEDRLNNHAVEMILEYGHALNILKPQPGTLVKAYNANYLEQTFYIVIHSLVQVGDFNHIIKLVTEHEIASCTAIYNYFSEPFDEYMLHKIEATVQQDIAYLIDQSPRNIRRSIQSWREQYANPTSLYYPIAIMTSRHVCNLLKALFATEQYELFEKLMEIYKKYLLIESHYSDLRDFVASYVDL